eukprot:1148251-Pelagomonas_calceolata.AAC.1
MHRDSGSSSSSSQARAPGIPRCLATGKKHPQLTPNLLNRTIRTVARFTEDLLEGLPQLLIRGLGFHALLFFCCLLSLGRGMKQTCSRGCARGGLRHEAETCSRGCARGADAGHAAEAAQEVRLQSVDTEACSSG